MVSLKMASSSRRRIEIDRELEEIVGPYLVNRQKDLKLLHRAIAEGDFNVFHVLGHRMRGAARSFGFTDIEGIGERLETSGKEKNLEQAQAATHDLEVYLSDIEVIFV